MERSRVCSSRPLRDTTFGGVLVVLGLGVAFWMRSLFGLVVVAAGVFLDMVVYTLWLKRRTARAIIFGGISAGMPILAGRALVTGRVDGLGLLLALPALSGVITLSLSLWALVRPSEKVNHWLFKFASVHMLGSMVLITWGALV